MNTHADKTQENKSQSVSNGKSQMQSGGESTFQFVDNRPEAVTQRKLQEMANNSPQALQLREFQEMANNSPRSLQVAQLQRVIKGNDEDQYKKINEDNKSVENKDNLLIDLADRPIPQGAADKVVTDGNKEQSESNKKKAAAKVWVEEQLSNVIQEGSQVVSILDQVKTKFGLKEVMIDLRSPSEPKIGFQASPWLWASYFPNKMIGNNLSDWLIWGYYGSTSEVSRWIHWKKPQNNDQTDITWGPLTGRGFGSYMLADPLTKFGPPGSAIFASNPTWEVLLKRRQKNSTSSASYYVLGHLLSQAVYGPGDDMKNLTPLSQRTNNHSPIGHLKAVENTVKNEVEVGKAPLSYQVIPKYGRNPLSWPRYLANTVNFINVIGDVLAAEDHVPTGLYCKVWRYDSNTGGLSVIVNKWVPEMQVGKIGEDPYYIETPQGMIDLGEPSTIWNVLDGTFKAAIGAGLGLASINIVDSLLADYSESIGMSVVEFVVANEFSISVITGLLSGYLSSGKNQFPKDPSLKQD